MADAKTKIPAVRLTADMRRHIVRDLVANAMDKREADHTAGEFKLALKAYNTRYSAADRKKMEALPKGWLPTAQSIGIMVGSHYHRLHFGASDKQYNRPSKVVFEKHTGGERWAVEARSEIGLAISAWAEVGEQLCKEREALRTKASAVVESVSSTQRLIEVWPEAAPFVPKHAQPRLLPVVRREELNVAFGLPALAKAGSAQ